MSMLDPRVFEHKLSIVNHDCRAQDDLAYLGQTSRGISVHINRTYMEQFTYYSPQTQSSDYWLIPGQSGRKLILERASVDEDPWAAVTDAVLQRILGPRSEQKRVAVAVDGPYAIPVRSNVKKNEV